MSDDVFSVADQVVLVSGGTRGIGRAIAEGFATRGAHVIVTGRTQEAAKTAAEQISALSGVKHPAAGLACDVSRRPEIDRLVADVIEKFGRVDTLLNVAGVNRRKPAESFTEDDYEFILGTNLKGAFFLSQAVGKHMLARGQGSQINVASLNNYAPLKHVVLYAMSKAGLGHMTRVLAMEWGERGVRVNALAPGFIVTDLTRQLWARPDMQAWGLPNTPLRRLGVPEDMVGTALFLASKASAFMTGQVLFVDGGFSAGLAWPIDAQKT
ncbi:MAG: glucose 1-dehydrogenase [Planctomycetia bacterium]|nr:glucose 1-dehydrogenase [Planctomycetia bacterium]